MLIIERKKLYVFKSLLELFFLLASSIFYKGILVCALNEIDLKCYVANETKTNLSLEFGPLEPVYNCNNTCGNVSYDLKICFQECQTFGFMCKCMNTKRLICGSALYKCECEKSPWITVLIIVPLVILLAILVASVIIISRRRRKALKRAQKYTLIARMSSEQQEDKTRQGKSVRIKSYRMVEEHSYEVVLPKGQRMAEADQSKVNFNQYLKYIQKDGAREITGNDTLSYKQKETTPKVQIDASFKSIPQDGKDSPKSVLSVPIQQTSTGYISSLLNSQSEKFKRTRSSRSRKPTGFTLRRTASEWHTDRLASYARGKTKSYGDLSKVPFYFELEREESKNSHPDCQDSSSTTYAVATCIPSV